jgi:hypothetical protein
MTFADDVLNQFIDPSRFQISISIQSVGCGAFTIGAYPGWGLLDHESITTRMSAVEPALSGHILGGPLPLVGPPQPLSWRRTRTASSSTASASSRSSH